MKILCNKCNIEIKTDQKYHLHSDENRYCSDCFEEIKFYSEKTKTNFKCKRCNSFVHKEVHKEIDYPFVCLMPLSEYLSCGLSL